MNNHFIKRFRLHSKYACGSHLGTHAATVLPYEIIVKGVSSSMISQPPTTQQEHIYISTCNTLQNKMYEPSTWPNYHQPEIIISRRL